MKLIIQDDGGGELLQVTLDERRMRRRVAHFLRLPVNDMDRGTLARGLRQILGSYGFKEGTTPRGEL